MKRYFLDTEFVEDGSTIMPISLALLREDGYSLYIEFEHDEEKARAHAFVRENILPHLSGKDRRTKEEARRSINEFMGFNKDHPAESKPSKHCEIWAYYAPTDWVVFYQIFGTMMDLPKGCPRFCMDLQQWWVQLGRPEGVKPPQSAKAHHALADTDWNLTLYERLERYATWFHGGVGTDPTEGWKIDDARDRRSGDEDDE